MNIEDIARKINERSKDYQFSHLQEYRKQFKHLNRIPTNNIFSSKTIFDHYAFHVEGRKEIQYNIAFEDHNFRYGMAFSLRPSQDLKDISLLFPKIFRLNILIREKSELFLKYNLWYFGDNGSR
jgi:hypothetical protein